MVQFSWKEKAIIYERKRKGNIILYKARRVRTLIPGFKVKETHQANVFIDIIHCNILQINLKKEK